MAKWSGLIGYSRGKETSPGVWTEETIEKRHYGDVIKDDRRYDTTLNQVNDNITLNNNISIVSNKFAIENLSFMRYITFMNSKWKIKMVDIRPPRIVITIGGLYNEG